MEGRKGVVKLMHTTDSKRKMTFEMKSRYQFIELRGSKMKDTSGYLRGLFRKALEGCNDKIRAEFLSDIDNYLQEHDNRFDSTTLVNFVTRLEDLQSRSRAVEEPYTWPERELKQLRHPQEIEPWNDEKADLGSGRVEPKGKLGEGVYGTVSRVQVPLTEAGQPLPQASRSRPEEGNKSRVRSGEGTFRQAQPRGFSAPAPGAILPPAASRTGRASSVRSITTWRSKITGKARNPPTGAFPAQGMKGFIRGLAQDNPKAFIAIYAAIMPEAKGEEVNKMIENEVPDVQGPIRNIAIGAYKALNQLHQHGFAHNDIKPQNMFYDEDSREVTFIDTGLMQKHSKGGKSDYVQSRQTGGTPPTWPRRQDIPWRTVRKRIFTASPARCWSQPNRECTTCSIRSPIVNFTIKRK